MRGHAVSRGLRGKHWLTRRRARPTGTYFFSFGAFVYIAVSPRAEPWSNEARGSLPPNSASVEALPNSFNGMVFWVLVRLMICYRDAQSQSTGRGESRGTKYTVWSLT